MKLLPWCAAVLVVVGGAKAAWAADEVPSATPAVEEAASVPAAADEPTTVTRVAKSENESAAPAGVNGGATGSPAEAKGRAYGFPVSLGHLIGTGTFVGNPYVRGQADSVVQSWTFAPYYKFDAFGHRLKASAQIGFDLELTTPNTNPARRISPRDIALILSDGEIYKESFTGIGFSGAARILLPTSVETINVRRAWLAVQLSGGMSRSFGPLALSYGLAFSKNFNSSAVAMGPQVSRDGAPTVLASGVLQMNNMAMGQANVSSVLQNSLNVGYDITKYMNVSYFLAIFNLFRYSVADERDEFTSIHADPGVGRMDLLSPTLTLSYQLTDALVEHFGESFTSPVNLSVRGGITAFHPAQTANNDGIIWPFFYQAFASNRAANNYGALFFNLVGVY